MPLKAYGVLKGRAIERRLAQASNPHYQIHLIDDDADYRVAVNVKSKLAPSELEYLIDPSFRHPVTEVLGGLSPGFTALESRPGGGALDFIRGNLFDRTRMRPLAFAVPGLNNDLNEEVDRHVRAAMADEAALVYAFGERWGPESQKDKIFGFRPGNGIHDVHMNQGNAPSFATQDGVWQDGALLIHFPGERRWVGVFLKFQSQTWHTEEGTGHRIERPAARPGGRAERPAAPGGTGAGQPDLVVRVVAALVNPPGPAPEPEMVTLLNTSPASIDLTGWVIADRLKNTHPLAGTLAAGAALVVRLAAPVQLGNQGGIITLLDAAGLKVHGVSYTRQQAEREGWTIAF